MGSDPDHATDRVYITFEYTDLTPTPEPENYVEEIELDPQSQYNLARRLMIRDIYQLYTIDSFGGKDVTYEDIVMAALENGYITFEDLQYVVQYDDLWNKKKSTWQRIKDFIFDIGRTSTLFLPPPWNVVGAIGLVVTESTVNKINRDGTRNDNPAAIID